MNDTLNNYVLGRGELFFAPFRPGTRIPIGEDYLGNTPELTYTAESEMLEHYNSDRGIRRKDASVMLQLDYMGSFICDNIAPKNLARFFLGESFTQTTLAQTGLSSTFEDIMPGLTYQLGTSSDAPSGMRNVVNVEIDGATIGVDYVVDSARGRVTLLDSSEAFTAGDALSISFDVEESVRNRIISKSTEIQGAMRFLSYNATGTDVDYFMPWVKLTPNGDYNLKGDEWQQLGFNLEILQKTPLESVYLDGQAYTLPGTPAPAPTP